MFRIGRSDIELSSRYHAPGWLCALLVMLAGTTTHAIAQDAPEVDSSEVAAVAPENWWKRNPLTYDAEGAGLLFHVEGNYTFEFQRGNVRGETHNGSLRTWLRDGRMTLMLFGGISYQDLSLADGVSEVSTHRYQNGATLDYALSTVVGPQAGVFMEHDDAAFIETRRIGYLGIKFVPVSTHKVTLSVLPAFGYQHEEAILTGEERSFWSPYIEESLSWQMLERLAFEHSANFLFSVEHPDTWRASLVNGFMIPVTDFLSVTFNHELRYNSNPIPTDSALQLRTGGVGSISKADNNVTAGIRLQY